MNPTPTSPAAAPPRKKFGCLFYGCLTVVIVGLVVGAGIGVGVWYLAKQLTQVVERFTDPAPAELGRVEMAPAEFKALESRLLAFGEAVQAGRTVDPLQLGASELNALLAQSPLLSPWKDRVQLRLEGNQVRARLSLPLDQFGEVPVFRALRGRYLNGDAALQVGLINGQLDVRLVSMSVKGVTLPAEVTRVLGQQNLAEPANQDTNQAAFWQKLAGVVVEGGRLVITPREP